jgi:hypothetical protein
MFSLNLAWSAKINQKVIVTGTTFRWMLILIDILIISQPMAEANCSSNYDLEHKSSNTQLLNWKSLNFLDMFLKFK